MLERLGLVLLALMLVVSLAPALQAATPDEDMKGAATEETPTPALPATTQLGLVVMVLLVMTASAVALLGGGLAGRLAPAGTKREAVEASDRASSGKGSPKNKSRRAFAQQRDRQSQARKGWNVSRRGGMPAKPRRRGGPGCRGVR
jgi:hypothetical protein